MPKGVYDHYKIRGRTKENDPGRAAQAEKMKGNTHLLGKKYTSESKKNCRIGQLGRKHTEKTKAKMGLKGDKNPAWKGGIGNLSYHENFNEEFRKYIRDRDNNTCQLCGKNKEQNSGRNLTVHHIEHDKMNDCSDEFGFITLCTGCNVRVEQAKYQKYYDRYFMYRNLALCDSGTTLVTKKDMLLLLNEVNRKILFLLDDETSAEKRKIIEDLILEENSELRLLEQIVLKLKL